MKLFNNSSIESVYLLPERFQGDVMNLRTKPPSTLKQELQIRRKENQLFELLTKQQD